MPWWAWFGLGMVAGAAALLAGSWLLAWTYGRTR